jgi:hypothetical protein
MRKWPNILAGLFVLIYGSLAIAQTRPSSELVEPEEEVFTVESLGNNLIVIATIVGTIAALPTLIEFLVERRKRKERIDLSIEDEDVNALQPRLAGFDVLLEDIADLIDRAANPSRYSNLEVGNEILILGPPLSGKKSFAQVIAKRANLEHLITVWNVRNADVLAAAKSLIQRYSRQRIMVLLPNIDLAYAKEDDELLSELDALIETTSERANVLVVGTASKLTPDSPLDNAFGIKLCVPGTPRRSPEAHDSSPDANQVLSDVAMYYLQRAQSAGMQLQELTPDQCVHRLIEVATNSAEIEDIVALCMTTAKFRQVSKKTVQMTLTPQVLQSNIDRVIVNLEEE